MAGRKPKPWYDAERDKWRATINKVRHDLCDGSKLTADGGRKFHELMADRVEPSAPARPGSLTIKQLAEEFQKSRVSEGRSAATLDYYDRYLEALADRYGDTPAAKFLPIHIVRLCDGRKWTPSDRRKCITTIKSAYNWAVEIGLLQSNPVAKMKKPPKPPGRRRILTPEETARILGAVDKQFRMFLDVVRMTGCRPGEAAQITAADCDFKASRLTLYQHKTGAKTGKPRVVYMPPEVSKLLERLAADRTEGPLLLNRLGKPWNKNAWRCRFRRLREKLGLTDDVTAYSLRHTFATAALVAGESVATVAELLGHADTRTTAIYSHLDQHGQHLADAAKRIAERMAAAT